MDVLLYCHDVDRALVRNGKAYSAVVDWPGDVLVQRGYSVASLAARSSRLVGARAHRDPAAANRALLSAIAIDRLRGVATAGHATRQQRFWSRLLGAHRPRAILGISITPAMCRAARNLGVTTIEAVHGFGLTEDDWVMGTAARAGVLQDDEPDVYIAYDRTTQSTLSLGNRGKRARTLVARPSYMEIPAAGFAAPAFLADARLKYRRIALLTMQHGYDGTRDFLTGIIGNGILHADIEAAIANDPGVLWLMKVHPVQLRGESRRKVLNYMQQLKRRHDNLEWRETSTTALAELLHAADVHVTMSSGSVYEAAMLGVRSVAFCPSVRAGGALATLFEDLVAAGWVRKDVTDTAALQRWIAGSPRRSAGDEHAAPEVRSWPATADVIEQILKESR